VVGSKKFTESVVLGEIARLSLAAEGLQASHRAELGGTRILWNALLAGNIDLYPEYTGTIEEELLRRKVQDLEDLRKSLAEHGIGVAAPLGFNNTYAIGMKRERADELGIRKISDLARHPGLKIGWGEEFRRRRDGWPGLRNRYNLPQRNVRGLDHDIAYRALEGGDIELMDLYSTDAEIQYYDILVLEDDLAFFPRYEALFLYRLDSAERSPGLMKALERLSGRLSRRRDDRP
jgi:osmoprotectant transport system permease protein